MPLIGSYSLPHPQKMTPKATPRVAIVTRSTVRYFVSSLGVDVVAEFIVTPFAGSNRSRFKGLRLFRTLSASAGGAPLSCVDQPTRTADRSRPG